jgi:hypothetical protein
MTRSRPPPAPPPTCASSSPVGESDGDVELFAELRHAAVKLGEIRGRRSLHHVLLGGQASLDEPLEAFVSLQRLPILV